MDQEPKFEVVMSDGPAGDCLPSLVRLLASIARKKEAGPASPASNSNPGPQPGESNSSEHSTEPGRGKQ